MGYASGVDGNGRAIGYGVEAECEQPRCGAFIDRGLWYRCGGFGAEVDSSQHGCGGYFCGQHLYMVPLKLVSPGGGLCAACLVQLEADCLERMREEAEVP